MARGTVKWFDTVKGHGSIIADYGEELVFRITEKPSGGFKPLTEYQRVEFELVYENRNLVAKNVALYFDKEF